MSAERPVSGTLSLALRTRLVRAGGAVAAALAVATCGGDAPTAVANILAFAVQPATTVAGAPIPAIRVEIRNSSGTIVTSFAGNVTLAITTGTGTGGAILSGTSTVAAVNGVATLNNLSINRSGTGYRLTASTATLAAATSALFDIAAGAMSDLVFTVQPGAATAGAPIAPAVQVTARDALGNTATGFTGSVTMAIGTNPAGGTLSGATSVNAVAGVANFAALSVNRSAAGYTLTASTAGPPIASVTSAAFTVNPGAASALLFTVQPSNATAGAAIAPAVVVTVVDAQSNVATGFAGAITLAIGNNPGGGTLGGTPTVGAVNGVATFNNVNVNRTGAGYTLAATAGGLAGATSASFNIAAGVTSQLAFMVQPSAVTAGAVIAPAVVVQAQDAAGNPTPSFTGDVTVAIANNAGGGALTGTLTAAAVAGAATFADLSIDKSGAGYTLGAAAGGLTGATSAAFNVVAGAAATLEFSVEPVTTAAGEPITPAVQVTARDALDNVATGFTGDVTVAIDNNPSGGVLSGNAMVAAVAGVATFADLRVDKPGNGYTLTANATGLTAGTSNPFAVNLTVQQVLAAKMGNHTCAVTSGGTYCWGNGGSGQLGDGTGAFTSDSVARLVSGNLTFTQIAAGQNHTCALTAAGAAYCWGQNAYGQLGDNSTNPTDAPVAVSGGLTFASITAGRSHTCGRVGTALYCWGRDNNGQLGDDATLANKLVPTVVAGGLNWTSVSAGYYHTCGITGGNAYCWGWDGYGQLGNDALTTQQPTPVIVAGAQTWTVVNAGYYHTCGVNAAGAGYCWGTNYDGRLGADVGTYPLNSLQGTPVPVFGGLTWSTIQVGWFGSCGLTTTGSAYCWGYNYDGQLGDGTFTQSSVRVAVAGGLTFNTLSVGGDHSCGRVGTAVWCWGYNGYGQLGDGSALRKNQPVQIVQ